MLCGLALVPQEDVMKEIVSFRSGNTQWISGEELGLVRNIPHLSIVQCPFDSSDLTCDLIEAILDDCGAGGVGRGCFSHLSYQPKAWVFANVVHDSQLDDLQAAAMRVLERKIHISEIDLEKDFSGYTKRQVAYYARYGYRYLKEEFLPHVTLGRTIEYKECVDSELVKSFALSLAGREFSYDRLAFYRAGESGVFAEELASVSLR